jgi:hypothetical protein
MRIALSLVACLLVSACSDAKRPQPIVQYDMTSIPPSCTDKMKNGDETDIDCGGASCPKCANGQACGKKTDCMSGFCIMIPGSPSCDDGSTCKDNRNDGDETGVDCGGPSCGPCGFGQKCVTASDCQSGVCNGAKTCDKLTVKFDAGKSVNIGMGLNPQSPVAADFDGDGKVDIAALSNMMDGVFIALGKGDGTFMAAMPAPTTIPQPDFFTAPVMATGDVDGDGKPDLVVTPEMGAVFTYLNNTAKAGMPSFAKGKMQAVGTSPGWPTLVDVDGDKKLDLVVTDTDSDANSIYTINVLLNGGAGAWKAPKRTSTGMDLPTSTLLVDMDGDGKLDLVALFAGKAQVALGKGDGSFGTWAASDTGLAKPTGIQSGDFDNNGAMDLIAIDRTNDLMSVLFSSSGPGMFLKGTPVMVPMTDTGPNAVVVSNFDLDAYLDLALASYDNDSVGLLSGTGTPMGGGPPAFTAGASLMSGPSPKALTLVDLNGDGKSDMLVSTGDSDTVTVILNRSM